jgi:hypothetical protein
MRRLARASQVEVRAVRHSSTGAKAGDIVYRRDLGRVTPTEN